MVKRFKDFSYSLFEIYRCWHKLASDEMAKYGLKGPHAIYLVALHNNEEGLTSKEISDLCSRDKADVSRALALMESKGLISRQQGHSYRSRIKLTELGSRAARHVSMRASVAVTRVGKGIREENRAIFYQSLQTITQNMHQLSQDGLPE